MSEGLYDKGVTGSGNNLINIYGYKRDLMSTKQLLYSLVDQLTGDSS